MRLGLAGDRIAAVATVRELQGEGRRRLAGRVDSFPGRESSRLLAHLLGLSEGSLPAFDDREVEPETERRFLDLVDRRAAGEPAAYLTGGREFFGRRFQVDRRVLVPRPETEHLIEIALGLPVPARARVLDVGTGSGAIAVTLAAERPEWRVVGADLSLAALAVARGNGRALLGGASPPWVAADLVSAIDLSSFDLVVSNPPYVDPEDGALDPDVRAHEPLSRSSRQRVSERSSASSTWAHRCGRAPSSRSRSARGRPLPSPRWRAVAVSTPSRRSRTTWRASRGMLY